MSLKPFTLTNRTSHNDYSVIEDRDPTCPDCKGARVDKHDFDCVRCGGEGVVDE